MKNLTIYVLLLSFIYCSCSQDRKRNINQPILTTSVDTTLNNILIDNKCYKFIQENNVTTLNSTQEIAIYSICLSQSGQYNKAKKIIPEDVRNTFNPYEEEIDISQDVYLNFALWFNYYLRDNMDRNLASRGLHKILRKNRHKKSEIKLFTKVESFIDSINSLEMSNNTYSKENNQLNYKPEKEWKFIQILRYQLLFLQKGSYEDLINNLSNDSNDILFDFRSKIKFNYSNLREFDTLQYKSLLDLHLDKLPNICSIERLNTGYFFDFNVEEECAKCLNSNDAIDTLIAKAWLANIYFDSNKAEKGKNVNKKLKNLSFPYMNKKYSKLFYGLKTSALLKQYYLEEKYWDMKSLIMILEENPVIDYKASEFGEELHNLLLEIYFSFNENEDGLDEFLAKFGFE